MSVFPQVFVHMLRNYLEKSIDSNYVFYSLCVVSPVQKHSQ